MSDATDGADVGLQPDARSEQPSPEDILRDLGSRTTITFGETRFTISKLPARKAYRVWRKTIRAIGLDIETGVGPEVLRAVVAMDDEHLEAIQAELFAGVMFTNQNARTPQRVAGAEDTAFEDLEAVDIDELTMRAFAVNFSKSLQRVVTVLQWLDRLGVGPTP